MRALIFSLLMLMTIASFATEDFHSSINRLEQRLTDIVKSYDDRAQVLVFAKEKKNSSKNVKLPSIPFLIREPSGLDKDNQEKIELSSLEINVFSRLEELPKEIQDNLIRLGKEYYAKPTLKLNKVAIYTEQKENPMEFVTSLLSYIFGGIGGLSLIFLVVYVRRGSQLKAVLETQFSMLATSFSESSGGGGQMVNVAAPEQSSSSGKSSIEINTSSGSQWEEYSIDSLIAVIADCYWCHEDEYAAFVWKRMSIAKRNQVLESGKVNKEYISFLSNFDGEDKGYIDEPYYINPLPIEHLNNDELLKLIRQESSLVKNLSKLRANHLPIKAKERLEIYNNIVGEWDESKITFDSVEASDGRILEEKVNFRFSSIEEESEIVSLSDMTFENMRQFPSLAWLTRISAEEASDILNAYTAKQLASIWIGPEDVLEKLGELVPTKKRDLLNSYLMSVSPTREHPIYEEIINLALESYKEENSREGSELEKKAA